MPHGLRYVALAAITHSRILRYLKLYAPAAAFFPAMRPMVRAELIA